MPASGFDIYYVQDARNNFDAMRPSPIFADANQVVGQCQPIHISTNCYYGYHEAKMLPAQTETDDCEMMEVVPAARPSPLPYTPQPHTSFPCTGRKRSATADDHPQTKRLREGTLHTILNILKVSECVFPSLHCRLRDSGIHQKYCGLTH